METEHAFPGVGFAVDLRRRLDSTGVLCAGPVIPIAVHSIKYCPIQFQQVYRAVEKALNGFAFRVVTAGTLGNHAKFFMTVQLLDHEGFEGPRGDVFKAFLTFITSHDGSLAMQAFDANTRVCCENTLNYSLAEDHNLRVHTRHVEGADMEIEGMAQFINDRLVGRQVFVAALAELEATNLTADEAYSILYGWRFLQLHKPRSFSDRTKTDLSDILALWDEKTGGIGNTGKTAYDLFNAVTQYYTKGNGINRSPKASRATASTFGAAADHKTDFYEKLSTDWELLLATGKQAREEHEENARAGEKLAAASKAQ